MLAGLICMAEPVAAANPARHRVRILRVDHVVDAGTPGWDTSMMNSRLPKFADATASAPREIFSVCWEPEIAAPAGILVTFELLQEHAPQVRFLSEKYDWVVDGEEKAVFRIDVGGTKPKGMVTAWRARVVYRGRLLAETTSATWR